ncbi:MAG: beta-ketoacyl-[acyl-carrier-protein] synthase II, partial [Armatimonadetes bacterium]|nr:beta-ketoacyl-[acyl-carrier-protein] synthase II [Armatimonadota bacterium]
MSWSLDNLRQRVVITGLGVVSPVGIGKDAFWDAVVQGRSGIDWIEGFDTSDLYCRIGGQVR